MVSILATSCSSNNHKSNNKNNNDSTEYEHQKPIKFTEEQEKNDMI